MDRKDIMKGNDDWPILTFFHRAVSLLVACVTLVGLFVGWEFIQAQGHVTRSVFSSNKIDIDGMWAVYEEKGKVLPATIEETVTAHNEVGHGTTPIYICPKSPLDWEFLVRGWAVFEDFPIQTEETPIEDWIEDYLKRHRYEIYGPPSELVEARLRLVNIVRSKFEFGEPPAACAISLTLAIRGELEEEELSFAADALKRSEYALVFVSLRNDGNGVAPQVKVVGPESSRCEPGDTAYANRCESFDLEVDGSKTVQFRASEPGLFLDKSDLELEGMFEVSWKIGPDKVRILRFAGAALIFTFAVIVAELAWKSRTDLVDNETFRQSRIYQVILSHCTEFQQSRFYQAAVAHLPRPNRRELLQAKALFLLFVLVSMIVYFVRLLIIE